MSNRGLYLHEEIDIIGTGSEAYKAHTAARATGRRDGGAALVGTWQQCGSTGRWPVVINLWEMQGWEHWAGILERQYTPSSEQPPGLRRWWARAARYRSGGFDRILVPAPFSPTRAELVERGVRGAVQLQEIATVPPGTAERYLDAVATYWHAVAARRGLALVGAWRNAMHSGETVVLWCLPSFRALTDYLGSRGEDPQVRRWTERARALRLGWRETVLVPSLWCVTHPAWSQATRMRLSPRARRAGVTPRSGSSSR